MAETIKPLKTIPQKIKLAGDYASTQYALILGLISKGEVIIHDYNQGTDTNETIEFLRLFDINIEKSATEIKITPGDRKSFEECAELKYDGGILALTLIIGCLAGINETCTLIYSDKINPDAIDYLIKYYNRNGIDLFHESDDNLIVFRGGEGNSDEYRISEVLPYLKNSLLMFGLANGQQVIIKEKYSSDNLFEKIIERLGGGIECEEAKSIMVIDPNDPRKKIRKDDSDCRRKIVLKRHSGINGGEITVPSDFQSTVALMSLAMLKRDTVTLESIYIDSRINRFIKLLKSSSAEIEIGKKISGGDFPKHNVTISGNEFKGRKISGSTARYLMELLPYLAVCAGIGNGNTVIRDAAEYVIWQNNPYFEISNALQNVGIKSGALEDGLIIEGKTNHEDDRFGPYQNREAALAFYMLALTESAKTEYQGFEIIKDNYWELVDSITDACERGLLAGRT